jgi:basic membrane lipoprotein Med (substrate-binding protein (PBP1-ABC) superfamily)
VSAAVVAGVAMGLGIAGLGPGPGRRLPPPRARVYENADACLLTGPSGVSGGPAAQAWAGMEEASGVTAARVSYLAVTGPATAAGAAPFLGSLLVRGCRVIVAAGGPERAAVLAEAAGYPGVRFVVTGAAPALPNVTAVVFAPAGMPAAVAAAVESGVRDTGS